LIGEEIFFIETIYGNITTQVLRSFCWHASMHCQDALSHMCFGIGPCTVR